MALSVSLLAPSTRVPASSCPLWCPGVTSWPHYEPRRGVLTPPAAHTPTTNVPICSSSLPYEKRACPQSQRIEVQARSRSQYNELILRCSISFLGLPKQIAPNSVAENEISSVNSGEQGSKATVLAGPDACGLRGGPFPASASSWWLQAPLG